MASTVLLVEDDLLQREMMTAMLAKIGYGTRAFADARSALAHLQAGGDAAVDLAILDVGLPGGIDGLELLDLVRQRVPDLPVVMLTGHQDVDMAVRAMQLGAYDFMVKPTSRERLQTVLNNALKTSLLEKEVLRLKRAQSGTFAFENLIGASVGLADIIRVGRKASGTDIPVLLTGETGTGKEVFARAIHGESRRAGGPFVAVNCGAIPATLVESTLFGHEKGAFTGAIAKAAGKFREAEGGTIFLDEIGDLPLEAQVKILRVLQQKEVTPVGADHSVAVNVRVISATHHDLAAEVAAGRFREDLYFRLNVLSIHIPALRERAEDIPALVRHFVERFAALEGRGFKSIQPDVLDALKRRRWSGNVRELENAVHRAMVMAEGDCLRLDDFAAVPVDAGPVPVSSGPAAAPRPLSDLERDAMQNALLYYGGNVTQAAQSLGLAKSTFYRKLKEYGLTES